MKLWREGKAEAVRQLRRRARGKGEGGFGFGDAKW